MENDKATAHRLPCSIRYSGPTENVNEYFSIAQTPHVKTVETHFRGRRLRGQALPIVVGRVVRSKDEGEFDVETMASLDEGSVWYWNHDEAPNLHLDKVPKALKWIEIAENLHRPVARDELSTKEDCPAS